MNILYDISALGSSAYHERARTGVARVIEAVLNELKGSDSVDLSLSATWTPLQCAQARIYSDHEAKAAGCTVRLPRNPLLSSLVKIQTLAYRNLSQWKSAKGTIEFMNRPVSYFFKNAEPAGIDQHDLFHSTFYPVPTNWPSIKKVITIYDFIPMLFPQFFERPVIDLMRRTYNSVNHCERVLAISHSTKSDLCEFTGIPPERVAVTHLAASGLFRPCNDAVQIGQVRNRYSISEGPYLLSLCTLEPRKNIDQAIRAFIALIQQQGISDLSLVLVGTKGWEFDHIFEEIEGVGTMRDRIVVTGFVPDDHLAPLYSGALAFVYPSFYEGFGLPPLEAMQCGTPVITSNTSSLPEVVGDAGIMVDPNDTEALSQSMLDLYRQADLRDKLSQAGLARARKFSWSRCASQTVEAYQAALLQ